MINKDTMFVDSLKRAYEMEETLAHQLVELTSANISTDFLPAEQIEFIRNGLAMLLNDTQKHQTLVKDLIGKRNG